MPIMKKQIGMPIMNIAPRVSERSGRSAEVAVCSARSEVIVVQPPERTARRVARILDRIARGLADAFGRILHRAGRAPDAGAGFRRGVTRRAGAVARDP